MRFALPSSVPSRAAAACLLVAAAGAWAGPPFITDDPEPVDVHHWEVNYALTGTWSAGATSIGMPSVDINYGAAPGLQLHAQPRYAIERDGSGTHTGIDDTEIGVKYRFIDIERDGADFMLGVYPMIDLPTGNTGLGPDRGKRQRFFPLWAQWDKGDWTVYGGAGYRVNPGAGNRNFVFTGVTALYRFTPRLQMGGEVFHQGPDTVGGGHVDGFNLGGVYGLAKDYNLLFSAGRGLTNVAAADQTSGYLALQVLY